MEIKEECIMVYLLDNLSLIVGEDDRKIIKNAVRIMRMPSGPALSPLFSDTTENKNFGLDLKKKDIKIICARAPERAIVMAYMQIISGNYEAKKVIQPGPREARYFGSRN